MHKHFFYDDDMKTPTKQQEKFIEELVAGKSQREAYRSVYKCDNWKDSSIDTQASKLMNRPEVLQRYQELMQKALDKTGDDAATMRAKIIEQEKASAFYNAADFYEMKNDMLQVKPLEELTEQQQHAIKYIRFNSLGFAYFVFNDREDAMERLSKLYKLEEEQKDDDRAEVVLDPALEGYAV